MRIDLVTREFPPFVYGGAGVHVEELSAVLKKTEDVRVHCFDGDRTAQFGSYDESGVKGYPASASLATANPTIGTLGVDLSIAGDLEGADIIHSHTWYANFAGFLGKKLYQIPHVISAHSLEPLRPWKAEQLGGGYRLSSWIEKTSYEDADGIIAVSKGMREDILKCYPNVDPKKVHVVHNGIDLDSFRLPDDLLGADGLPDRAKLAETDVVKRYGIDVSKPTAIFVGRITRQKGVPYLLKSIAKLPKDIQIIFCAGAPDTKEILAEVSGLVADLQKEREGMIWIEEMLPRVELISVLSASDVFLCPSVYEPLGIVNLEAMACGLPVVATKTGGIPEVVLDKKTGFLVPIEQVTDGTGTPKNPEKYVDDFANATAKMFKDLDKAKQMGAAGYERARDHFTWTAIAERTIEVYNKVLKSVGKSAKK